MKSKQKTIFPIENENDFFGFKIDVACNTQINENLIVTSRTGASCWIISKNHMPNKKQSELTVNISFEMILDNLVNNGLFDD